jgi:hypothetical protein
MRDDDARSMSPYSLRDQPPNRRTPVDSLVIMQVDMHFAQEDCHEAADKSMIESECFSDPRTGLSHRLEQAAFCDF